MFSFLMNAAKYILGQSDQAEQNIDELIAKFEDDKDENETNDLKTETIDDNTNSSEGWFYANGTITTISGNTLVIDDCYYYDAIHTPLGNLDVGTKVNFMAYQKDKDEQPRVRKIIGVINNRWDDFAVPDDVPFSEIMSKIQIIKKSIVAKVMARHGREVILEPGDITISLDRVSSTFVPYVGDWLKLECLVELDDGAGDLAGEILEVEKIAPLRSKLKIGLITKLNKDNGVGVVERDSVFSKIACQPGYIPCVGDKVVCDSIESDQEFYTWRCLTVVPLVQKADNTQQNSSLLTNELKPTTEYLSNLCENKYGITITDDLEFNLEANEMAELKVDIENGGQLTQTLRKGAFMSKKAQSQLTLVSPAIDTITILKPGDKITYIFRCSGKFVGTNEELFIFCFKNNFSIGRNFKINVKARFLSPTTSLLGRNYRTYHAARRDELDQNSYIPGIRPCKPPSFITVRSGIFKIPQKFWDVILPCINDHQSQMVTEGIVGDVFPFLNDGLTEKNYCDRFHALLYLEEISLNVDMQRFDMDSASMTVAADFLVLKVPGLAEKRPSLITGDRAIVSFKWDSSAGGIKYEGCIHKVKSNEIYLKFNENFHNTYKGEDCMVTFKSSYSSIGRCHNAVNLAIHNLGSKILFPTFLKEREPQIDPEENEQPVENSITISANLEIQKVQNVVTSKKNGNDMNKSADPLMIIKKRKLIWYNKQLNYYQREAVRNILRGVSRPLPYVIFGPPGTGKTVTLCEAILQTLTTMPDSRLLVATPSNSSANLIAEKLLDSNVLKPGDLVRLVAHHCLNDDSIPEKLLPYCATGDLAAEGSSQKFFQSDQGVKINCKASVLGRHRITVGTCISLGLLYNMGFPRGHFSHIFVDEAGQATEPEIMVPLTFTHCDHGQIILAGDPMQLGPVVNSKLASHFGLGESFLVRLLQQFPYQRDPEGFSMGYDPRLVTKLLINYRSLPEILALPNSLFYESELLPAVDGKNSPEVELLRLMREDLPIRNDDEPPAIVFHGVDGENKQDPDSPSWYNPAEATQVYLYLLKIYEKGLNEHDVGIITPYKKQVFQIRQLLMELDMQMPKVGSVEEFQGQERKVIILSTVRSTNDYINDDVRHALGFVASPRRLNVAITRSRVLLIILGNPKLLSQDIYWRSVLTYCIENNSYTGCDYSMPQLTDDNEEQDNLE